MLAPETTQVGMMNEESLYGTHGSRWSYAGRVLNVHSRLPYTGGVSWHCLHHHNGCARGWKPYCAN